MLHTAGLAAEPLRTGLTRPRAAKAVRHLRALVGAAGLAVGRRASAAGPRRARASTTATSCAAAAERAIATGRSAVLRRRGAALRPRGLPGPRRGGGAAGRAGRPRRAGALVAVTDADPAPGLVQATLETARWVGRQLALAELDTSRARLARAEVRALRAQISPHFIYNALTAIASFVRTDPERARELILEFAEFTRYSFRAHGEFTTLAEELRSIDRYLTIERARFGDRLQVRLQIAPEVLPVGLPFLCLQPLVENAVRHGLSRKPGWARWASWPATPAPSATSRSRTTGSAWIRRCSPAGRGRRPGRGRPARRAGQCGRAAAVGRSATGSAWWWRRRRVRGPR